MFIFLVGWLLLCKAQNCRRYAPEQEANRHLVVVAAGRFDCRKEQERAADDVANIHLD
jgi:hypothetical protein